MIALFYFYGIEYQSGRERFPNRFWNFAILSSEHFIKISYFVYSESIYGICEAGQNDSGAF